MKRKCFYCKHIRSKGAGAERTDGGENFKTICAVTKRDVSPSANGCAEFAPDRAKPKKEKPQAAKQGAAENKRQYTIKSTTMRKLCRGLGDWQFAPKNESEELLLADTFGKLSAMLKKYVRKVAFKAMRTIGE